jgi:hypothetical protein
MSEMLKKFVFDAMLAENSLAATRQTPPCDPIGEVR